MRSDNKNKGRVLSVYSSTQSGHRPSYLKFFRSIWDVKTIPKDQILKSKNTVLFLMLDECFLFFVLQALVRSLFQRRTVGLLFNPFLTNNSFIGKSVLKFIMLRMLKHNPYTTIISILPFFLDARLPKVADTWIFDIQFFDLSRSDLSFYKRLKSGSEKVFGQIALPKQKKMYISAIGRQSDIKGIEEFINIFLSSKRVRENFVFVIAGELVLSEKVQNLIPDFISKGGLVFDNKLSDDEILFLYSRSYYVWVCYSSEYDQSSGIFGRAVQLNVPSILRKQSMMASVAMKFNLRSILLNTNNERVAMPVEMFVQIETGSNAKLVKCMKSYSVSKLKKIL